MFILGLSGGMGMGKSATSDYLRHLHIPVHDSDKAVHHLMQKGQPVYQRLKNIIPKAAQGDEIDRQILSERIKKDPTFLKTLEMIIHPLVRRDRNIFIHHQILKQQKIVVLDIPLLFETGLHKNCDGVAVVDCPKWLQIERILKRGISPQKMKILLNRQWSNDERKRYSDYVIPTGLSFAQSRKAIRLMLKDIAKKNGRALQPSYYGLS